MSSGVGSTITFGTFVAEYLMVRPGGAERVALEKPFLADDYVTVEADAQARYKTVTLRVDVDGLAAEPPIKGDKETLLIKFPLNDGESTQAQLTGDAQVIDFAYPEFEAGSPKFMDIEFEWNTSALEPAYTAAS